jgi:hypothetical protein
MLFNTPASFFTATLADSTENAHALLMADHVVDHLCEKHRLAHTRATEQSSFASSFQWHEHIDRLDTRLEDFGFCRTLRQGRWSPMDGPPFDILRRRLAVNRRTKYIKHPRHDLMANRYLERPA